MADLAAILAGVGEAPAAPFVPAPFQNDALDAIDRGDVVVSAPTGSGKTWIAEEHITRTLAAAAQSKAPPRRVWYTTPLKALSNQKFRRFQRLYGETSVGLLTGERRVNVRAPVLVATTEILRNVLYDTRAQDAPPGTIVLDEAHYISDPERGTAWEEILLLAPRETRLLLLSATIPNAEALAAWMGSVRGRAPEVITLAERAVPLAIILTDGAGQLLAPDPGRVRTRLRQPRWLHAVNDALDAHRLTPAIMFFPSRRECDDAARALGSKPAPRAGERAARIEQWIERTPQLAGHPLLIALRRAGVASHHAGHLTSWRLCVEELLEAGLLRLVCATTTLAAGLDVPARTVVLSTLYRHGPGGSEPLTPTEFHQMTGRAGRRGRDTLGIAVIACETSEDAREGLALADASPDPVISRFTPSDAQVLNLLARAPAADAEAMLRRSFAAFQRAPEIAAVRARLATLPADPLRERPCGDRLATRSKFDDLLHQLRRARRRTDDAADEIARLGQGVVAMPCTGCTVVDRCLASLKELAVTERERRALRRDLAALEDREVAEFRARAGMLRDLGYLDQALRLTDAGHTAARIRHPRMLVIAEAIRARVFPTKPAALASVAGALGTERLLVPRMRPLIRHGGGRPPQAAGQAWSVEPGLEDVSRAVVGLRRIVVRLNAARRGAGLPLDALEEELTPTGNQPAQAMWRASAVGAWGSGRAWGNITTRHHVPDGDLQRLIWQAAEILTQMEDLPGHLLVAPARDARAALLRAPVV